MTMHEAALAMGGRVIRGSSDAQWSGAALDSRKIGGSELFFALEGAATDGHRFVAKALSSGAAGAVVREPVPIEEGVAGALVQVEDTYRALHDLVRRVRRDTPQNLIAITGSAGKTTTKELLALMLAERYRTAASPGNLNNLFGFPLALLGIPQDTEWMVAEMAMSTPGELGGVSRLGRPRVAIFTNVRHVHVEAFERAGDPAVGGAGEELIANAKAELLEGLDADGLVIVNAEDRWTVDIARRHLAKGKGRVLGFSLDQIRPEAQDLEVPLVVKSLRSSDRGHRFTLRLVRSGESVEIALPLHGTVNVENFLAAATCAVALDVDLQQISLAMAGATLPAGRGGIRRAHGALIVDDSYNSNPSALERALRAAARLRGDEGTLWAVLGEMKELGSASPQLHRQAGELAGALGFELVVGVGEMARELLSGASDAGAKVRWYANAEAARSVAARLRPSDVVLVKGSRSVGLERVVAALEAEQGEGV